MTGRLAPEAYTALIDELMVIQKRLWVIHMMLLANARCSKLQRRLLPRAIDRINVLFIYLRSEEFRGGPLPETIGGDQS